MAKLRTPEEAKGLYDPIQVVLCYLTRNSLKCAKKQSKLKVTSSFAFEVDLDMVDARSVCASGYIYILLIKSRVGALIG